MKLKHFFPALLVCALTLSGCNKFLDEKPNIKLAVPSTLDDFQALLDNSNVINSNDSGSGEVSADNYFLTDADYQAISPESWRRMYSWQKDYIFEAGGNDWLYIYQPVFTANTVLNSLDKVIVTQSNQNQFNNVKGQALFVRAVGFYQAATLWSPAYDASSAVSDLGIPLRLSADFNERSVRSNVQQTYDRIVKDLNGAIAVLPLSPLHVMRASKPAAYALLARTYLSMRKYDLAKLYADSCLQLNHNLLDYNSLNATATYPIPAFNPEVLRESKIPVPPPIFPSTCHIATALYNSYAANDLRKTIYFKSLADGTFTFKGSYEGGGNLYSGVTTDEVYLMRAECYARASKTDESLADLNTLLIKRWKTGTFVPFTAANATAALSLILTERQEELLMRGLRWMDLKRLNKEGANIAISRTVAGQTYILTPNDLRYALSIPEDIIQLSGMPQNP